MELLKVVCGKAVLQDINKSGEQRITAASFLPLLVVVRDASSCHERKRAYLFDSPENEFEWYRINLISAAHE